MRLGSSFRIWRYRRVTDHNQYNEQNEATEQETIPELRLIRNIVKNCLPEGHRLNTVDLTIGTLHEGEEPRFMVLVELEQQVHAPEPFGWADRMAKIIRQKWPRDEFDIK